MKNLFLIFTITGVAMLSEQANANCLYTLKHDALMYEGYTLNFAYVLEKAMTEKKYERSFDSSVAALEVVPAFKVGQVGQFQVATAGFALKNSTAQILTEAAYSKRCFTQNCAVSDAQKALVGAIHEFSKKLVACTQ